MHDEILARDREYFRSLLTGVLPGREGEVAKALDDHFGNTSNMSIALLLHENEYYWGATLYMGLVRYQGLDWERRRFCVECLFKALAPSDKDAMYWNLVGLRSLLDMVVPVPNRRNP